MIRYEYKLYVINERERSYVEEDLNAYGQEGFTVDYARLQVANSIAGPALSGSILLSRPTIKTADEPNSPRPAPPASHHRRGSGP